MADLRRQISRQVSGDNELDDETARFMASASVPRTPSHELMGDAWPETDGERRVISAEQMEQAQLLAWEVRLLGVDFESADDSPRSRASLARRYQDLLSSLKAGSFSWAKLQLLLGDLPTELPAEAFQTTGLAELSDTATQISMELFRSPPKFVPSFALEEIEPPSKEEDSTKATVPQLSLRSSRLMGRRLSQ